MSNQGVTWRTLSAEELAAERDARFGGAIAVFLFAAAFALAPLPLLMAMAAMSPIEFARSAVMKSAGLRVRV
jgi:hypothetical protein